ncbi:MAG: PDZ domain-containing protein [Nanoarchaeota archaeon]|nr:PDZ domain-containing protein [Nanoarchaeota archaeon]
MEWFDLGSALIFYAIVLIFVFRNRSKFQKYYGIIFLYKMKLGLKQMYDFGRKYEFALKVFATIGIIVGFYFMFLLPVMLTESAVKILTKEVTTAQVGLLIPGVRLPGSTFFVPFWYGIISLIIIAFIHEFGHAIVGAAEGVKPKNDGFGFLFFIPVFFVEFDEKKLLKKSKMQRMRISAAGPMANLVLFAFCFLLVSYVMNPVVELVFEADGVLITGVSDGFPAKESGLTYDLVVTSVNSTVVSGSTAFKEYLDATSPGDQVVLSTSEGDFNVFLTESPDNASRAYMGVTFTDNIEKTSFGEKIWVFSDLLIMFYKLLTWIGFLSLAVGAVNFVPLWIADGGQIFHNTLLYFVKNEGLAAKISSLFFWFVTGLFIINLVGPFIL